MQQNYCRTKRIGEFLCGLFPSLLEDVLMTSRDTVSFSRGIALHGDISVLLVFKEGFSVNNQMLELILTIQ
jgi:hypothetical protein